MSSMLQKCRVLTNIAFQRHLLLNAISPSCLSTSRPSLVNLSLNLSSEASSPFEEDEKLPKEKVSKAMRAYLDRAREHDEFMKKQQTEFQIGKRHLANMMGIDPDTMTQADIDGAIEYLFPSGLFEKRARPIMRPPEEIFPQKKAAEFDELGRPHHYLFYTMNPNFYQVLNEVVGYIEQLEKEEDQLIRQKVTIDESGKVDISGSDWLPKESMEKLLMEKLNESQYVQFEAVMNRLIDHPLSGKMKDFVMKYRKPLMSQTSNLEVPKPLYDSENRAYITVKDCMRKSARAEVTIRMPGTGKVTINGQDITFFSYMQSREQVSQAC